MKSYEERLKYILERRDEQIKIKEKRRRIVLKYSALAACFCITVILGCQVFVRMETVNRSDFIRPAISSEENTSYDNNRTTVKTTINTTITYEKTETNTENTAKAITRQTRLPETQITDKQEPAFATTSSVPKSTANGGKVTTRTTSSKKPATANNVTGSKTTVRVPAVTQKPVTTSVVLPNMTDTKPVITIIKPVNSLITISKPESTLTTSLCSVTEPVINTSIPCTLTSIITVDYHPLNYEIITEEFSTFTFKDTVYHLSNELNSEQVSQISDPDSSVHGVLKLTGKSRSVSARILPIPDIPPSEAVAVVFEERGWKGRKLVYCMYKPM